MTPRLAELARHSSESWVTTVSWGESIPSIERMDSSRGLTPGGCDAEAKASNSIIHQARRIIVYTH